MHSIRVLMKHYQLGNASVTRSLRQQEDDDDTYTRNAVDHNHEANASHAFGRETYAYVKANAVPLFDVPTASLRQRAIDQAFNNQTAV